MKLASQFPLPETDPRAARDQEQTMRPLYFALVLLAVGMLAYSQTYSLFWDEGFHILAARLIDTGKRPYLDFFFPQTPLNAYWNAAWMALFGPKWRVVHVVATLVTMCSVLLIVQYLAGLFPDRRWRLPAAFAGLALFGLHAWTWMAGTISQAYPLCMLLVVAAFRAGIRGVGRPRFGMSALAGLLAGAAGASSLLTALISPVLLLWMWLYNRAGSRWIKAAAFLGGAVVAWAPVLFLFARAPHEVTFNILKYHTLYRRVAWEGATVHDIGIVTDWVNSSPNLLLVLLALAGLLFIKKSEFDPARRAEVRLCLWLAVTVGVQNTFAHPTFAQYFVFMIPFLTVLAVVGFYAVVARLENPDRLRAPVILLIVIMALCLGNTFYNDRDTTTWRQLEQVANKVMQVTPKGTALAAPEAIYFLANWPIPPGMEHDDAHKLKLPPAENARLHILPKAELDQRIKSSDFSTTVICDDDDFISHVKDWHVYSQSEEISECTVFWKLEKKGLPPSPMP
jgi:4-amino-4-deoxy-L-arabinose transferase-like glycosyltransferase